MKIVEIALAAALVFGSIAAASAQGGGAGGGNSPAAATGQGASSSPGSANPGATTNDPKMKGKQVPKRTARWTRSGGLFVIRALTSLARS